MQHVYQIIGKSINTKYYFDALDDESDAKVIVDHLNKQKNNQGLWFGYITIPVHKFNDYKEGHYLQEWYQDDLKKPINTDLKEEF